MMKQINFHIDGKLFSCPERLFDSHAQNSLTIQSVPRPYSLTWDNESDPFVRINQMLTTNKKNLLLIDQNILNIYQPTLQIEADRIFAVTATEDFKTLEGAMQVLDFLQHHEFTKGEQLIVVGGGITQDIAGFVSAIFKRGINWIYFPTTLLSMCDSSIGGKAGVNYKHAKNQLALFSTPKMIFSHPHFLNTLDTSAITSGLGEILKLCIIGGDYFLDVYRKSIQHGKVISVDLYKTLILTSLAVKKAIIEEDEFEFNDRKALNYGHTIGHAIETLTHYQIPHGQAVVIGMILVNELSHKQGLLDEANLIELNQLCLALLDDAIFAILKKIDIQELIGLLKKDKKTIGSITSFVFVKSPGDIHFIKLELTDALVMDIDQALQKIIALSQPISVAC